MNGKHKLCPISLRTISSMLVECCLFSGTQDDKIVNGLFGTVKNVQRLTSSAVSRFERRVPGMDRNKKCQLHMEV